MDFAERLPEKRPDGLTGLRLPAAIDALIALTRHCEQNRADGCLSPQRLQWVDEELSLVTGGVQAEFAAPELRNGHFDSAADVYSIGRILDWAAHRDSEEAVPRGVSPIVADATESDPARRPTLSILRADLLALRGTLPPERYARSRRSSTLRPPSRGPTESLTRASGVRRAVPRSPGNASGSMDSQAAWVASMAGVCPPPGVRAPKPPRGV